MRLRFGTILVVALLCLAPTASWADLTPYSQDFEGLDYFDPAALANDGWLVFGNGFSANWDYLYGYGPFDAPNNGQAFCAIALNEGGPAQGVQQLSVFGDYNNGNQDQNTNNQFIEANTFQEQTIGAADVGSTWIFEFEARRGNIEGQTTARAFFKTIVPSPPYPLTNFISIDMTNTPATWESYQLPIFIDPSLEGQILQFGFLATTNNFEGSGIFYDNVNFGIAPLTAGLDIKPGSCPNPVNNRSRGLLPVAVLGAGDLDVNSIDVASLELEGVAPVDWGYEDVSEPYAGDLCGCAESFPDGVTDLTLKFDTQELIDAIGATPGGDRQLSLTGTLLDGTPLRGEDCVVIIGPGPRPTAQSDATGNTNTSDLQQSMTGATETVVPQGNLERLVRKPRLRQ